MGERERERERERGAPAVARPAAMDPPPKILPKTEKAGG
jgi:hypothetical protein